MTVGCFAYYDWLSTLLQYNPIVSINATLLFIEDFSTLVGPQRPVVPSPRPDDGPPSQLLNTIYTIQNVQAGETVTATCAVLFQFDQATAYSGRNEYATNSLLHYCQFSQTVTCEYLRLLLLDAVVKLPMLRKFSSSVSASVCLNVT